MVVGRLVFVLCLILSEIFSLWKNSERMIENDLPLKVVMTEFDGVLGGCRSSWIVDQRCFEFSEDFTLLPCRRNVSCGNPLWVYLLHDSVSGIPHSFEPFLSSAKLVPISVNVVWRIGPQVSASCSICLLWICAFYVELGRYRRVCQRQHCPSDLYISRFCLTVRWTVRKTAFLLGMLWCLFSWCRETKTSALKIFSVWCPAGTSVWWPAGTSSWVGGSQHSTDRPRCLGWWGGRVGCVFGRLIHVLCEIEAVEDWS